MVAQPEESLTAAGIQREEGASRGCQRGRCLDCWLFPSVPPPAWPVSEPGDDVAEGHRVQRASSYAW